MTTPGIGGNHFAPSIEQNPIATCSQPNRYTGLESMLASISRAGMLGDSDLAMAVIAEQIRVRNSEVKDKIKAIRNATAASKALRDRIAKLRQVLTAVKTMNNGDEQASASHGQTLTAIADKLGWNISEVKDALMVRNFSLDPDTGQVEVTKTDNKLGWYSSEDGDMCSPTDLEQRISILEGQQQQGTEEQQVLSLGLQNSMSKKANLIEMLTNMMKKKNDSQRSIIGNMR